MFVGTDSIPGFNVIENIAGPQASARIIWFSSCAPGVTMISNRAHT